jgi:hypothetical protein
MLVTPNTSVRPTAASAKTAPMNAPLVNACNRSGMDG